ncbi:hypothetical protein Tco_1261801 [Tanacetum coccineum]
MAFKKQRFNHYAMPGSSFRKNGGSAGFGGSKGFGCGSGGNTKDSGKIPPIRINDAHNPYSLDMVLQDAYVFTTSLFTMRIGIGDIVPIMFAAGKKIHRTVVVEDAE